MSYLPIIGLEIHVQPKTQSKMFCGCSADIFGAEPNTHTCPVCLGLPGALPVPNRRAVEATIQLGLALGAEIAEESKFDRKNYFYPDLPKGYQISQYDQPIATGGFLNVTDPETGEQVTVNFTRVHLEEDTGKLIHAADGTTRIDFNRGGMPLIEIVTEPDIHSAAVMKVFLKKLRLILRYAGISDADMEKGTMRLEPNVSVATGTFELPSYKVELKNINSFRFAERATEYEIARQIELLEKGETPTQETRGWNEDKGVTVSQRTKEEAHDYRYFPEPDIPPMVFDTTLIENLKNGLPELPHQVEERLQKYEISPVNIETLLEKPDLLAFAEAIIKTAPAERAHEFVIKAINQSEVPQVSAAEFIQQILEQEAGQVSDTSALSEIIETVLSKNPAEVARYKEGKQELLSFFMGKIMAETKGKADPKVTREILQKSLSE